MSDPTHDDLAQAAAWLEAIAEDRALLDGMDPELRIRFLKAAGMVSRPDRKARKKLNKAGRKRKTEEHREQDQTLLALAQIRKMRDNPLFKTPRRQGVEVPQPKLGTVHEAKLCYVCRSRYTDVHFFYDQMCLECGDFNYKKRMATADLTGRVSLVTGARLKIGYQAAIILLRAGSHVIVLTRFPADAAARYAREEDFEEWKDRLEIHGIDLRHSPSVEALCHQIRTDHVRLDFLINNACQTVRRPPAFYKHMLEVEQAAHNQLSGTTGSLVHSRRTGHKMSSAEMSQLQLIADDFADSNELFPAGRFDADLQQVDLRDVNSWRLRLDEVSTVELLEVQLVNAVAPYLLNARLKPLMMAVPTRDKHIVNVSAMEGQFYRTFKGDRHPHTNMAKASLNMMTRTSAQDYVQDGIHMNSVDTGWVSDEDPAHHAARKQEEHNFHPPLDIVDGAARIVDPILDGINTGKHLWGLFLKDYKPTDW
ncbi:MAG: SDR family NAD(P)-dependent oxidoreductase [Proteobacteria bacterium]|nr:SDR family NAD(P)-dependent oxidoreductase [Pseudomonadota bacterium]